MKKGESEMIQICCEVEEPAEHRTGIDILVVLCRGNRKVTKIHNTGCAVPNFMGSSGNQIPEYAVSRKTHVNCTITTVVLHPGKLNTNLNIRDDAWMEKRV
jgi:hypothetical protein